MQQNLTNENEKFLELIMPETQNNDNHAEECATIMSGLQCARNTQCKDLEHVAATIKETLIEITKIREHHNERRHRQLMHLLSERLLPKHTNDDKLQYDLKKRPISSTESLTEPSPTSESNSNLSNKKVLDKASGNSLPETRTCAPKMPKLLNSIGKQKKNLSPNPVNPTKPPATKFNKQFELQKKKILEMHRRKMEERERKKEAKIQR